MYDDFDFDYSYTNDCAALDEIYDAWVQSYSQQLDEDFDDEYERNVQDYDALAYKHYAW